METQYAMVASGGEAEPAKSSRRSNGRRAQEATTRPVKMIGATSVESGITRRQVGGGRSRHVEEHAGVGPFLEPRETRGEHRYRTEHLPDAEDDGKARIAEMPQNLEKGGSRRMSITPPTANSAAMITVVTQ